MTSGTRWLLATERTEQDRGAERVAFALARQAGAGALPVVMPLAGNPEYEASAPHAVARAESEFAARRESLLAEAAAAGVALAVQVRRGSDLAAEIVEAARETAAHVLVIRRRGRRGLLSKLLVGEMVGRVLARAPCDVLVVPRDVEQPWCRGVLVGVDPERPSRRLVARAASLARDAGLPLHLLAVIGSESARDAAEAALREVRSAAVDVTVTEDVRVGAPPELIVAAALDRDADLIVVTRRAARAHMGLGSVAHKVIGLARCPVLVVDESPSTAAGAS